VDGLTPEVASRKARTDHEMYAGWSSDRSGSSSRSAGSSTCTTRMPARSRSATSSRSARATWSAETASGWSSRTKDHARIVTGPVSIPFIGFPVRDCAYRDHSTVIGPRRRTAPHRIEGRVHREP